MARHKNGPSRSVHVLVVGMPKEAIARGAVGTVLPLGQIAPGVRRIFSLGEE